MDYASSPGAAPDGSAGHKRHLNRPPTRIITRWTQDQLESLLLSVFKVMSDDDISLDWDEVGRLTNEHSTGGAILQMIVKLRLKRLAAGKRVPPPLQLKRVVRRAGSVKAVSFGKPRPLVKTESDAETLQNAKKSFGSKRSRIKLERRCKTFLPKPSAAYPLDWNRDVSTETGAKYGTPYRVRHTSIDSTETASDPLLKRLLVTLKLRRAILAHYVTSDRFNSTQPRAEVRCPTALPLELVQENASANSGESINLPQGGIEPSNSNSFSLEDLSNHDASMHVDEPTIFSPRSGARPPYPTMLSSEHFFNQDASPNVGEAPHLPVRDDGSRFRGMFEVESGYHCLPEHYSMPDALPHVHGSGGPHYPFASQAYGSDDTLPSSGDQRGYHEFGGLHHRFGSQAYGSDDTSPSPGYQRGYHESGGLHYRFGSQAYGSDDTSLFSRDQRGYHESGGLHYSFGSQAYSSVETSSSRDQRGYCGLSDNVDNEPTNIAMVGIGLGDPNTMYMGTLGAMGNSSQFNGMDFDFRGY